MKQLFQDLVNWDAKSPIFNVKGKFTQETRQAMAEDAMKQLTAMNPEIKYLSEKSSTMIDLKKAIEHTIDYDLSKDMVGATSKMLALKNIGMAVLDNFLGYHTNRARLAFVLKKAGDWEAKNASRIAAFEAAKGVRNAGEAGGTTVYKYDAQGQRMVQ
jgi:poly-gamma-glutamate capsule biosynthesis protein CapA/YwtB (metallophosphatase superfamily)